MNTSPATRSCCMAAGVTLCSSVFVFGVPPLSALAAGPPVSFTTQTQFATGPQPDSVALGDVDDDGHLDMVTANTDSDTFGVSLGDGLGGFGLQHPFAVGDYPASVALGDLNGDGTLDVVTANAHSDNVSVLLGDGSGGFGSQHAFATGTTPSSVSLGDLNGDGDLDMVTANFTSNDVSVLLGDGFGGFGTQTPFTNTDGRYFAQPQSVALGDVNGDGLLDVATANFGALSYGTTASVLLGTGSGGFASPDLFTTGATPAAVALGDFNGDGNLDLVTANSGSANASVLLGTGSGDFGPQTTYPTGDASGPFAVALGDLNGDGFLDMATANSGSSDTSVLLGTGSGDFSPATPFSTGAGTNPWSVALGDLNGDGKLDMATANHLVASTSVLLSSTAYVPANTVSPTRGATTGGTKVKISGTNFTGATSVKFGATRAPAFSVDSDTQITATTPARAAGLVGVSVVTPRVTVTSAKAFAFIAPPKPPALRLDYFVGQTFTAATINAKQRSELARKWNVKRSEVKDTLRLGRQKPNQRMTSAPNVRGDISFATCRLRTSKTAAVAVRRGTCVVFVDYTAGKQTGKSPEAAMQTTIKYTVTVHRRLAKTPLGKSHG